MVPAASLGSLVNSPMVLFCLGRGRRVIPLRTPTGAKGGDLQRLNHTAVALTSEANVPVIVLSRCNLWPCQTADPLSRPAGKVQMGLSEAIRQLRRRVSVWERPGEGWAGALSLGALPEWAACAFPVNDLECAGPDRRHRGFAQLSDC